MGNMKFSDRLLSFEKQAGEIGGGCMEDWLDYFHMTVSDYFKSCEEDNKRASITALKKEIIKTATSELFGFK